MSRTILSPNNVVALSTRAPQKPSREVVECTDDELMALARLGRGDAFGVLVARYTVRLVQLCAKMTGNRAAAEEIAQDVWVSIWRNRESYVGSGKFIVFLVSAARNRCRNRARDVARWDQVVVPDEGLPIAEGTSTGPSEIDRLLAQERSARVHAALGRIPEKHREAVLLRFGEEMSYGEIAAVVGEKEETLRSRVHHGIRQLRAALAGEEVGE